MPYVLRENIYAYISQTIDFIPGDNPSITIVLYKDSLNNQLDVINYDQVKVTVFDHLKRKKATYAKVPSATELALTIGNKTNGEEGYVTIELGSDLTPHIEAGDVFVAIELTQSSYVTNPISISLPYLKVGSSLSSGTGTTGGSKQLPSNYKATVPATIYSVGDASLADPGIGQFTVNSSNPINVTAIKMHNTESGGNLNVYLNEMISILNSGANLLLTLTNFNKPDSYAMYRITSGNAVDLDNDGASATDRDDFMLIGVQFMAAASTSTNSLSFNVEESYGVLFDSYSGAGLQGPAGADGAQGAAGSTGAQGAAGSTGAQGAAGLTGAQGATGNDGAQGAPGQLGPSGAQGNDGANGSDGAQGAQGADGATGAQGADGATGAQGAAGQAGDTGAQGADGATGAQG